MNNIDKLREHLFETLDDLKKSDKPNIERAKAVCEVAGKIIDTAKVEVDYLKVAGGRGSGFIPQGLLAPSKPPGAIEPDRPALIEGRKRA